ncbi:hypothetical protein A4V01_02965 [Erysipelotrichaceae bacterium I46]|nr:hypothetical protein A4V01_02965 [Erysipelotrichaceae bacterium I46]ASU19600.1 hypothetical protein ADH65_14365 [[Clostridium] innocuum]
MFAVLFPAFNLKHLSMALYIDVYFIFYFKQKQVAISFSSKSFYYVNGKFYHDKAGGEIK